MVSKKEENKEWENSNWKAEIKTWKGEGFPFTWLHVLTTHDLYILIILQPTHQKEGFSSKFN